MKCIDDKYQQRASSAGFFKGFRQNIGKMAAPAGILNYKKTLRRLSACGGFPASVRQASRSICATGFLLLCCGFSAAGCGTKTYELEHAYDVYGTSIHYEKPDLQGISSNTGAGTGHSLPYFAQDLCVGENVRLGLDGVDAQAAEALGVFRPSDGTITHSKKLYKKLYPASTTKILTAYIALKYGKLSDTVTISAEAAQQELDSSVCYLRAGDTVTLEDLLYGLLLKSGNDAADAIAEHISGDADSFAKLMNKEARKLGATRSHFTNPHGLQDENHYTCVYDLYLIFHAALEYDEFKTVIQAPAYTVSYADANGIAASQEWENSNRFLNGTAPKMPQKVTVIGGKTGTTNDAGYCLVLYSETAGQEPVISIVMKAEDSDGLYNLSAQLLDKR